MESREKLIESLGEAQARSGRNWISPADVSEASNRLGLSAAAVKGVASYYSMLSLEPRGRHVIRMCASPVCRMAGSLDLLAVARAASGAPVGGTDPSGAFTLETCQCLGRCAGAPAMTVDDRAYARLDADRVAAIITATAGADGRPSGGYPEDGSAYAARIDVASGSPKVSLRYDLSDPADSGEYGRAGGWAGLKAALAMPPDAVVEELSRAKVRGRGGAGFPTGQKERAAAGSACVEGRGCERFVVCNADEGEPGTFKDRVIMERSPLLLLEGMLISAYAIGASRGFIYIRGEYGPAIARVRAAVDSARRAGYLGPSVMGTAFSFDVELRLGAGSYLCGEELTLIESLEGKRGYPRIKPPFPAEAGFRGRPTLVNNVETLSALPWVIERGADAYLALGAASSPGTKVFCLSGDVSRPGYGEWEMGVGLGELIEAAGGAIGADGRPAEKPLAVLLGGAAGTFVPGDALDLRMDYDSLKAAGATLGSGAVIVLGPGRSVLDSVSAIMDFFAHESCGKCVPCRVGTARLAASARALAEKARDAGLRDAGLRDADLRAGLEAMVADAERIAKASLCPLGQSPILPLRSASTNLTNLH
ncbi:MAG: NAD(P)H-dependent oxidoreductase subunit E [Spirochaetes bacterium]|nr:NAD(P)H-dependent oxidoreductase subunit E [Spirochaetota bacterium]MBU1079351.1 NAD(P)H-dependent oxidoreductase subunit E [Spirochaetota bacterium]